MDDPDADQILTIEELRALRDQAGVPAAAPTAEIRVPHQLAAIPLEARADPWQDLRRRARDQRRWLRWARPLAAAGCLALAGGGVAVLVFTNHSRSDPLSPVKASVPTAPAPSLMTSAPVSVTSASEPSIVPPMPIVTAPIVTAPSPSAPSLSTEDTTEPRGAPVPPLHATSRPRPTTSVPPRPSPTKPPADRQPTGAAADRAGAANQEAAPGPTLTRTPTSWSPVAPP